MQIFWKNVFRCEVAWRLMITMEAFFYHWRNYDRCQHITMDQYFGNMIFPLYECEKDTIYSTDWQSSSSVLRPKYFADLLSAFKTSPVYALTVSGSNVPPDGLV